VTGEQIPLARPDVGSREEELVQDVLRSGRLSLGPMLERFEGGFASWIGSEEAVAVSSGTAALHLAVRALGWSAGDEVITTPLSFVASANCLLYEQAVPVFCDIDERTLNIDPQAAAAACGSRTAGLLPVHLFGYPADMEALQALAGERGLGVVEDACEALGAVDSAGVKVGASGNPAAFGFYANKQLVTGEGGMLTCGDARVAATARSERNQGRADDMDWLSHDRLGFNYRLSDVAAALGVAQVERLDSLLAERDRVAALYRERLFSIEGLVLPCEDKGNERRTWFVFVVQVPADSDRDRVIGALAAEGIASKAYLPCIHLQPLYRERFGFRGGEFPVAERVAARSLALPFYTALGEAEVDRVCAALEAALGR
jgi:perosamine synthetase